MSHWLLVIGYWLLVIRYWLLVIGTIAIANVVKAFIIIEPNDCVYPALRLRSGSDAQSALATGVTTNQRLLTNDY
ncbi:MAG: hypothetical protein ACM65M_12860 [Microcoleus sp.]